MGVADYSPNLAGRLKRLGLQSQYLDDCFERSIRVGGRLEQDFNREPESSYNPRPARVGQILLEDCGVIEVQTIAAAFFAVLAEVELERLLEASAGFPELAELLIGSRSCLELTNHSASDAALAIAAVVALDRARHVHLASEFQKHTIQLHLQRQLASYLPQAEQLWPQLALKIQSWLRRHAYLSGNQAQKLER